MSDIDQIINEAKSGCLPFESRESLAGCAAFCAFRDLGPERNIRWAVKNAESDAGKGEKRHQVWPN